MIKTFPTREQANELLENIINLRNSSNQVFCDDQELTFRNHCSVTAEQAEKIAARIPGLDKDRAYVLGLLHDAGRIKDERANNVYHSLVGYDYMNNLGYPDIARVCLTHSFYEKDFEEELYLPSPDIKKCKELIYTIEYDDYDRLIMVCDHLNKMGEICNIETRYKDISERYSVPYTKFANIIKLINHHKSHFDKKCDCDIYRLLGIE